MYMRCSKVEDGRVGICLECIAMRTIGKLNKGKAISNEVSDQGT
jgi:hypothetical protein